MVISVSGQVLNAWGFETLASGQSLNAEFYSVRTYEARGLILDDSLEPISGTIGGISYTLGLGVSVNTISQKVLRAHYADDEEKWRIEHKCSPPYLMILVGPTAKHEATVSHLKEESESKVIETYGRFLLAKAELRAIEGNVLPQLLSGLACSVASSEPRIRFFPIDQADFGKTLDGHTIFDRVLIGSGELTLSRKMTPSQIEQAICSAVDFASAMKSNVARFFQSALYDEDPVKKFIHFFLAIELETRATFKTIDRRRYRSQSPALPARLQASTEIFSSQSKPKLSLREQFIWCAWCVWYDLSDADVAEFFRLKKVRDQIAHGEIEKPSCSDIPAAEKFAAKLLGRS